MTAAQSRAWYKKHEQQRVEVELSGFSLPALIAEFELAAKDMVTLLDEGIYPKLEIEDDYGYARCYVVGMVPKSEERLAAERNLERAARALKARKKQEEIESEKALLVELAAKYPEVIATD